MSKHALLDGMRATLRGVTDTDPEAFALRRAQNLRGLSADHGLDLLTAFSRDVDVNRTASWADLIDYCRYSAMPVGRFVLDVHGESRTLWGPSDALCAALQVINHLQDCAKDYAAMDRVYLPADALAAAGCPVEALAASSASPALKGVIASMAAKTLDLLATSRPFAGGVRDPRLAMEVAAIQRLAEDLARRLLTRDPLCERVRHRPYETAGLLALAVKDRLVGRRAGGGA